MFQIKYLYLFAYAEDGGFKQSTSPPTEHDITMIETGLLNVFRWYTDAYEQLHVDNGNPVWYKVDGATLCLDFEEIGPYHA